MIKLELRDYQEECIKITNEMEPGDKKIISIATGGGKTIIFCDLISKCKKRALVVVPQSELKEQAFNQIKNYLKCSDDDIGLVQQTQNEIDKKIIIATRQSLTHPKSKRIEEMLKYGEFEFIIFDECHQAVSQIKKILKKIPHENAKVLGFTATPYNKELKQIFNGILYEKDILSLMKEGYLTDLKYMKIDTNVDISNVKKCAGDYNLKDLSKAINTTLRNDLIADAYLQYGENRQSIVYCVDIEHALEVQQSFEKKGISCRSLSSLDDKFNREKILQDFKDEKIQVLTNVGVLTTGFDYPALSCLILARPTTSKILYTQIIGRGTRKAEGKENCLILDLVDNARNNSLFTMKNIFDIENGETILESIENRKREKKEKEERERREEEERERLRLLEIELFNKDISNFYEFSTLDWFNLDVLGNKVFVLFGAINNRFYIYKKDEEYILVQNDNNYYTYIDSSEYYNELIEEAEELAKEYNTNFPYQGAKWKKDSATDKQIAILNKWGIRAKTKWDSAKGFEILNLNKYFKEFESALFD